MKRKVEISVLVTLKEMMETAEKRKIAVGAFNTPNLESLQVVMEAAEEQKLPVIVQFAQCHEPWLPLSIICSGLRSSGSRRDSGISPAGAGTGFYVHYV